MGSTLEKPYHCQSISHSDLVQDRVLSTSNAVNHQCQSIYSLHAQMMEIVVLSITIVNHMSVNYHCYSESVNYNCHLSAMSLGPIMNSGHEMGDYRFIISVLTRSFMVHNQLFPLNTPNWINFLRGCFILSQLRNQYNSRTILMLEMSSHSKW